MKFRLIEGRNNKNQMIKSHALDPINLGKLIFML
jgi:hypothetical protein